jgi:large subunit ribosomal protein L27
MAHKKGGGSTRNGRDSAGRRLGCKAFGGQVVTGGSILVRQQGNKFWPGVNVGQGRDSSLFAKIGGIVHFEARGRRERRFIDILPLEQTAAAQD